MPALGAQPLLSLHAHLHPLLTLSPCSPRPPGPRGCMPSSSPAIRPPRLGLDLWPQGPGGGAGRAEARRGPDVLDTTGRGAGVFPDCPSPAARSAPPRPDPICGLSAGGENVAGRGTFGEGRTEVQVPREVASGPGPGPYMAPGKLGGRAGLAAPAEGPLCCPLTQPALERYLTMRLSFQFFMENFKH